MSQPSAVEYVRSLSIEDREAVFEELMKECIAAHAPLDVFEIASETESLGYYFSKEAVQAQFEAFGPKLTPEYQEELKRRRENLDDAIPIDQVIADLKREEANLRRSREPVSLS